MLYISSSFLSNLEIQMFFKPPKFFNRNISGAAGILCTPAAGYIRWYMPRLYLYLATGIFDFDQKTPGVGIFFHGSKRVKLTSWNLQPKTGLAFNQHRIYPRQIPEFAGRGDEIWRDRVTAHDLFDWSRRRWLSQWLWMTQGLICDSVNNWWLVLINITFTVTSIITTPTVTDIICTLTLHVTLTLTLTFQPQNHITCRISEVHSLYQVWTLWGHSFLSYVADRQTDRQT